MEALTGWGTVAQAVGTVGTFVVVLRQLATERSQRRKLEARDREREH